VSQGWARWYRCSACGSEHSIDAARWRCDCGGLLDLVGGTRGFPLEQVRTRSTGLWRWAEALPFDPSGPYPPAVAMGEGRVPVLDVRLGDRDVVATLEYASPTLSFKDRGAAVLVAAAARAGADRLVADSSGNAGTAISAYAARAGLPCEVYVSSRASPAKLAQIRAHGADLRLVDGDREAVAATAVTAVEHHGGFYASHVWNPLFHEGTKTWAFDVVLHLGEAPDAVVLPVGNGTLLLGAARGFAELLAAGVIDRLPRLVAVQAEACAPIARAFAAGYEGVPRVHDEGTVAEGIAIGAPHVAPSAWPRCGRPAGRWSPWATTRWWRRGRSWQPRDSSSSRPPRPPPPPSACPACGTTPGSWSCRCAGRASRAREPPGVPHVAPARSLGPVTMTSRAATPKSNDPCWCGSGQKFKRCHKTSTDRIRPGRVGPMRTVPDGIERPPYAETGRSTAATRTWSSRRR
jgi:threonine synthase